MAAAVALWPFSAHGQAACTEREQVTTHLAKKYSEAPVAIGMVSNGNILEVFSSEHGETWTVTMTTPQGLTCLIAGGDTWETIPFILKTGARM